MPRKKSIKRNNKRQKTSNKAVSVQKMEKELLLAPAKIVSRLDKEIRVAKKQEVKLNKAVNKINAQVKKAGNQIKAATGKKRLKAATKKLNQAAKVQAPLAKQLQAVTQSLDELTTTQSRFAAMQKALNQFNVEWTKAAKQAKNQPKPKAVKAGKKAKKSKLAPVEISKTGESTMDNIALDDVTELAS